MISYTLKFFISGAYFRVRRLLGTACLAWFPCVASVVCHYFRVVVWFSGSEGSVRYSLNVESV